MMQMQMKKMLMATSLSVLLASSVGAAFAHDGKWCDKDGNCKMGKMHDKDQSMNQMWDKLGVSPDQKKQLEAIKDDSKTQTKPLMDQAFAKKKDLMTYLASPNANQTDALAKQQELSQLHDQIDQIHIQTMFKMKNILTPDQQARASAMAKDKLDSWQSKHDAWESTPQNQPDNQMDNQPSNQTDNQPDQ